MQHTAASSTRQPKSASHPKEFLTVAEFAALFGVAERTAWTWVGRGLVPSTRIASTRRIRRSDLDALFEKGRK
jgi:excisionase family DNA binding protein